MRSVAASAAALALLAACAHRHPGTVAYTPSSVEAYLRTEVARTNPGLDVTDARCATPLPARTGATGPCQVTVAGVVLDYDLQRLAGGRFEVRPSRPVVVVADVRTAIQERLGDQATGVDCGTAPVWQPQAGQVLRCAVTGGPKPRSVVATVDPDGSLHVRDA